MGCKDRDVTPLNAVNLAGCDVPQGISWEEAENVKCSQTTGIGSTSISGVMETTPPIVATKVPITAPVQLVEHAQITSTTSSHLSNEMLFTCKTSHGKHIDLSVQGNVITYSFGKIGENPDITLRVPKSQTSTFQWDGYTSSMTYRVNVPNGITSYSVFWSAIRDPESVNPVSAGVDVSSNGRRLATVACDPNTVKQSLEGVDLPSTNES